MNSDKARLTVSVLHKLDTQWTDQIQGVCLHENQKLYCNVQPSLH